MEPVYFGQSVGKFIVTMFGDLVTSCRKALLSMYFCQTPLFLWRFFPFVYEIIYLPLMNKFVTEKSQWTSHDIIIIVHFNTVVGF